jgi:hypothetical protein
MAHFYGGTQGNKGEGTRTGSKASGLQMFASGWKVGVKANLSHNEATGEDEVDVYLTSGSAPVTRSRHLGTFTVADLEPKPAEDAAEGDAPADPFVPSGPSGPGA